MGFHSLVNTAYFSEAARDWKKNGGRYTTAPHGSRDYFQYWEEQTKRCIYGYKVGDLWIPGRMYGYLNFFPISRVPQHIMMKALEERRNNHGKISIAAIEKVTSFPAFWEIHYEWWNFKHISWYGGEFMGVKSPGNKHICCLKTRGAGWSFLEAWDGVYNYNFIPGSKSYYFAAAEPFLIGDAIMDKVQAGLDWINEYSPYWKQNRQVKKSLMHQKASFLDKEGTEKGKFSEIIAQIVDKPSKTRGKRGRKITFEEFGSFPNGEKAVRVSLGSLSEGTMYVGQMSLFGTGGETGPGIQALENIFGSPEGWDMLAFPNVYDEGLQNTTCGYFVPCWRANSWYMDEDGNVDMEAALKADDEARANAATTGKPKDLDDRIAEYPRNPSEALQRINGNGFNIKAIDAQIKRLQTDKALQELIRYGDLVPNELEESGIEFVIKPKHIARPIEDFPHNVEDSSNGKKKDTDLTGSPAIVQRPYVDQNGHTPSGMYMITFDSYYKDETQDYTSLFSIKVWKQENQIDPAFVGLPVAWYAGRPASLNTVYEILFGFCKLYNAKAQGEISGGGQGVVNYARTNKLLHYLENEPDMVHNKEVASKTAGNSMLMNMPSERKKLGLQYLEDWHMEKRGVDENGRIIYTINRIYDIAFLREMRKFNPLAGNYDRISEAIIAMFMLKERVAKMMQSKKKEADPNSFYERELYAEEESSETIAAY